MHATAWRPYHCRLRLERDVPRDRIGEPQIVDVQNCQPAADLPAHNGDVSLTTEPVAQFLDGRPALLEWFPFLDGRGLRVGPDWKHSEVARVFTGGPLDGGCL